MVPPSPERDDAPAAEAEGVPPNPRSAPANAEPVITLTLPEVGALAFSGADRAEDADFAGNTEAALGMALAALRLIGKLLGAAEPPMFSWDPAPDPEGDGGAALDAAEPAGHG